MKNQLSLTPAIIVIVIGFLVVRGLSTLAFASPLRESKADGPKKDRVSECRVSLQCGTGRYLELRITDPKLIHELVEEPLKHAKVDSSPARYVALGLMQVRKEDGSEEAYSLFRPWGHYKYDNNYMIADFEKIRASFKEAIELAHFEIP